jgi:hypothetical protein
MRPGPNRARSERMPCSTHHGIRCKSGVNQVSIRCKWCKLGLPQIGREASACREDSTRVLGRFRPGEIRARRHAYRCAANVAAFAGVGNRRRALPAVGGSGRARDSADIPSAGAASATPPRPGGTLRRRTRPGKEGSLRKGWKGRWRQASAASASGMTGGTGDDCVGDGHTGDASSQRPACWFYRTASLMTTSGMPPCWQWSRDLSVTAWESP